MIWQAHTALVLRRLRRSDSGGALKKKEGSGARNGTSDLKEVASMHVKMPTSDDCRNQARRLKLYVHLCLMDEGCTDSNAISRLPEI